MSFGRPPLLRARFLQQARQHSSRKSGLRLRLIKIAARVVELKKQIKIHLPSRTPDQAIFGIILNRLPRLVT